MANGGRSGVANPRLTNGAPTQQSLTASGPQGGVKPSMVGGMTQMGGGRGMPMRGMTMAPPMREEVNPGGGLMQSLNVDQLSTGSPFEGAPPPQISDAEKRASLDAESMASGYDFKHLQRVQDTYGPGSTGSPIQPGGTPTAPGVQPGIPPVAPPVTTNLAPTRAPNINQTAAQGINDSIAGARKEMSYQPGYVSPEQSRVATSNGGGYQAAGANGQGYNANTNVGSGYTAAGTSGEGYTASGARGD